MDQSVARLLASVVIFGVCGISTAALAGVVREDKGDNDWEIVRAPYLWA